MPVDTKSFFRSDKVTDCCGYAREKRHFTSMSCVVDNFRWSSNTLSSEKKGVYPTTVSKRQKKVSKVEKG